MKCSSFLGIFCIVVFLMTTTNAEMKSSPAEELSEEEIYNINADMYCQTDYVIMHNLLSIENATNTYSEILGDDIKSIDCEAVLNQYMERMYKRLKKDYVKKGAPADTLKCFIKQMQEKGYEVMRYKFNALHGIEMSPKQKKEFREIIDKEISDCVEATVDSCWTEPSVERRTTKDL